MYISSLNIAIETYSSSQSEPTGGSGFYQDVLMADGDDFGETPATLWCSELLRDVDATPKDTSRYSSYTRVAPGMFNWLVIK